MAFDPATGSFPALWLMPVYGNLKSVQTGPELDMFEWQSNTSTLGYGTVHAWVSGTDTGNNSSSNSWSIPGGTTLSNFNTYGILWTPTAVSWYFNNSLVETYSTTSAPFNAQFAGQYAMFLIISQFAGCNWTWYQNTPCPDQVSPINMQVQWVHIYAAPAEQPSE
jgi:beta-glucanase (GH16 family)